MFLREPLLNYCDAKHAKGVKPSFAQSLAARPRIPQPINIDRFLAAFQFGRSEILHIMCIVEEAVHAIRHDDVAILLVGSSRGEATLTASLVAVQPMASRAS